MTASLVIASFGSSGGYNSEAFSLKVVADASTPAATADKAPRYGKLPEIHHIFRSDQKMPNILISTVFTVAAIASLPVLLGAVSRNQSDQTTSANIRSGCSSAATSTTFRKPCPMHHCLMPYSLALLSGSKEFSSCTTRVGTSFRHCQHCSSLA